ncbi:MAG: hypothetical protein J1F35_01810 [Erysipelotrichales bacterium]|nr:hypothetical protein [Erysipelotrichales bacterium]
MKNFYKLLITLTLFMLVPTIVFATSDSSGEQGGGAGIVNSCSPNCVGIQRSSSLAGVRITFVDASGKAVSASNGLSFDFMTYIKPGKENVNTTYNAFSGDRNKIALAGGGNYSAGSTNASAVKKFSAVAAAYNKYAPLEGSTHLTSLRTSGNTGGNLNGMSNELNFFLGLTRAGNPTYAADVNSFIRAIAEVSGGFNADDLIYKIAEGCNTGEEIFIVMEPIFFWSGKVGGSYQNYFGTLADSYHFFGGKIIGAVSNTNNMAYLIYYEREIAAYHGATGVSRKGFTIQSGADLLSTAGFGIAVDWANDPGEYCNSCSYVNGKFSYDNKIYPGDLKIPSNFKSIQEYAFTDRGSGGAGCCTLLEPQISSMPKEWQDAYRELCKEPEPECCTPSVPSEPPVIDVHNCCADNAVSKVIDSELDDLFCYDSELQVDFYKNRCENDRYKEELNEYCDIYCTERVVMEVPGAITATSGRYFKLTETSKGTTSPYIDGYRRCRVRIRYNEWRDDYVEKVKNQVEQYNEFQRLASMEKNYEEAIPTENEIKRSGTITATCWEKDSQTGHTKSDTATANFEYSYLEYTFSNKYYYYTVDLKDDHYSRVEIVNGSQKREDHTPLSVYKYEEAKAAYEKAVREAESKCRYGNKSSSGPAFREPPQEFTIENPKEVVETIRASKESAKKAYKIATEEAATLEEKIDECDFYFDDSKSRLEEKGSYDGKDAEAHYSFTPDLLFRYSQAYLGEDAKVAIDTLSVDFDRTCNYEIIYDSEESDVDEIKPDRYSGIYGSGSERMHDFDKDVELEYETGFNLNKYYDYEYKAEKIYTTDAKYHAECTWTEKDDETFTLVPSGLASNSTELNYTSHSREYKIYLSTFDGTYETYWDINNIGHKGGFTEFFKRGSQTCAGEDPTEIGTTITCKIHVQHELVSTGKCNGSNGTDTTIYEKDCEPQKEGYDLFKFKIVDEDDFFPAGTEDEGEGFAYNWVVDERGKAVMKEINDRAAIGATYAPENATIIISLNNKDMRTIKNYNASREDENGYSDFNMHCECPTQTQTNSLVEGVGCTQCKSYFIENLEKGIVRYSGTDHKVNVWASSKSLQDIRNSNAAKGRW